nr:hypothetical protein [uncultured Pedobacter sp.]
MQDKERYTMNKEQLFWNWFKENEAKYFFLNQINDIDEKERILDDFLYHLHKYCDQLFFEIGGYPNDKQDLIITAEGNSAFFDKVEVLVNQAPLLEYWNIIALKPAMGNGIIEYNGIKLDPQTIYFIPLSNKASKKIGLRVYIEDYTPIKQKEFLTATYLLLDNILGEKSNTIDIGHVEIEHLPIVSKRVELIEFVKLPRYVKWKKSKLNS